MFRQGGLELFKDIFSQAGVSAKLSEPTDDCALCRDVPLACRDVAADHLNLPSSIHAEAYAQGGVSASPHIRFGSFLWIGSGPRTGLSRGPLAGMDADEAERPARAPPCASRAVLTVLRHAGAWAVELDGELFGQSRDREISKAAAHRRAREIQDAGRPCQVRVSGESGYFAAP
jgi:hypothetical protein